MALLVGAFLLSHGWARAFCSPLAFDMSHRARARMLDEEPKDCVKWSLILPTVAGFLSAFQRMMGGQSLVRSIGKKRVQALSYAIGASMLFPFAILQLALLRGDSHWQLSRSVWPLSSAVAVGMVIAFFGDFYSEEKLLLPVYSFKAFQIVACCVCGLELLYGLDISLVGFLFCSFVLGIGVQELASSPGHLSWEALGDTDDSSFMYASLIKRPLQHIVSDKKSRKIAIFLLINTCYMVVEFFYGFLSNSLGLISDACHMLFDCAALGIGLYASYISRLPENSKFNFGYGRFEVLSGYANAVLLVLIASLIVLESIERIFEPPEVSTESLLLVSVGGLLVNLVGLVFFHEEHHHAHAGGEGCSHSHSTTHNSLHSGSHSDMVKVDHPVVSCDATTLDSEWHSHYYLGEHNMNHGHHHVSSHEHYTPIDAPMQGQSDDHSYHGHKDHHQACDHAHQSHQDHSHQHHGGQKDQHRACDHAQHSHQDHAHQRHGQKDHHRTCDHAHHSHQDHTHQHHQDYDHGQDHSHYQHHIQDDDHHDAHDCHNDHHDNGQDHCHHEHHSHNHKHGNDLTHHHDPQHQHHMDHNMYGIFLHVLADTLGSVGVVISTILIKYKGWLITDPACSIFLSALIIASVVPLLKNSAEILLQRLPRHKEVNVRTALKGISRIAGVKSTQRVHVWSFTNTSIVGSLHLQISARSERSLIKENVSKLLHDVGIGDLTLQVEET